MFRPAAAKVRGTTPDAPARTMTDIIEHVDDQEDCPVCCSPFTATVRRPVSCAHCAFAACTRCVKTFLTSTPTDPSCMNCHRVWNREFIDTHLTRSWREGELKLHREKLLFDRERSLLPATQPDVEIELQKRAYAAEIEQISVKRAALQAELAVLDDEIIRRQYFILRGVERGTTPEAETKKERRQFVAACPAEDCRGFLSTAYKCGTCSTQFCSDCREPQMEGHSCDPALVETMKAIAKDSRGCPRCGMAISKVSGCDQMYCTACDTAFSWTTGKVVEGVIHNPHYYERMKALKGAVPRAAGDLGGAAACNGWPTYHTLPREVQQNSFLISMLQAAIHVEQVILQEMPTEATVTNNTDIRVRYLLKEYDEKKLKQTLQQRDRKRQRTIEIRAPLELFVIMIMEFFVEIRRTKRAPTAEAIETLRTQITEHVNLPLQAIGQRYKNIVPQINLIAPKQAGMMYGRQAHAGYVAAGWRPTPATASAHPLEQPSEETDH